MIILDTNILIEILKGQQKTINKVQVFTSPMSISAITAMELIYGARNKQEVKRLEQFIELFEVLHLDAMISFRALQLVTKYAKSHTLEIPDSLIAATAMIHRTKLLTYNVKDFQFIEDLDLVA